MSVAELIQVVLMAFVLLAPTLMVAVLVSGLSRRQDPAPEATADVAIDPGADEVVGLVA